MERCVVCNLEAINRGCLFGVRILLSRERWSFLILVVAPDWELVEEKLWVHGRNGFIAVVSLLEDRCCRALNTALSNKLD